MNHKLMTEGDFETKIIDLVKESDVDVKDEDLKDAFENFIK